MSEINNEIKQSLQKIPLLSIDAGPRDNKWDERLKEELVSLITVKIIISKIFNYYNNNK
jgi:hypothetical protein